MVHDCNLSYMEGGDREDGGEHKQKARKTILTQKLSEVVHACHLSYTGSISRGVVV
jgi:hypothetical protein